MFYIKSDKCRVNETRKGKRNTRAFILKMLITGLMLVLFSGAFTVMQASEASGVTGVSAADISSGKWVKSGKKYAYVLADGTKLKGWQTIKGKDYYFDKDGYRVTGQKKIDGAYYYFGPKGVRQTGWKTIQGKRRYFDPKDGGKRAAGFRKIGKYTYFFNKKGIARTGLVKTGGKYYFFNAKGRMVTGWKTIKGKRYFFSKKDGHRVTGTVRIGGKEYYFNSNGVMIRRGFAGDGTYLDAGGQKLKKSTIKELLKTALKPVGTTMYVWGGGWNISDTGGDITARTIGVSPQWKKFFEQQDSSYDYTTTRYQIKNGLDCSGYVGWVIYNAFNTTSGNAGYVMLAQVMARTFSSYGWGSYKAPGAVRDFKAGDIMSTSSGHVYIVVGQCSDRSVVLLHSSPKGVMISGTSTPGGSSNSKAIKLAEQYMKKYYPRWYKKFPDVKRNSSYLNSYGQMRWHLTGTKRMMSDPEGYTKMNAAGVLKDLFGE